MCFQYHELLPIDREQLVCMFSGIGAVDAFPSGEVNEQGSADIGGCCGVGGSGVFGWDDGFAIKDDRVIGVDDLASDRDNTEHYAEC